MVGGRRLLRIYRQQHDMRHGALLGGILPAVIVHQLLLFDRDGRNVLEDREMVRVARAMTIDVLKTRQKVAGRSTVVHDTLFDRSRKRPRSWCIDHVRISVGANRVVHANQGVQAGGRNMRVRLAQLEPAPLGVSLAPPAGRIGGQSEKVLPAVWIRVAQCLRHRLWHRDYQWRPEKRLELIVRWDQLLPSRSPCQEKLHPGTAGGCPHVRALPRCASPVALQGRLSIA